MFQWWHFLMRCLHSLVQMKGTPIFAVLDVFVPPYSGKWRHCCHWWGRQIRTYRKGCQRNFFLVVFFYSLSGLDYSLTFTGYPLVLVSIHKRLTGNYLQMPALPALQKSIATPRNSGRFETGCASNNPSRSLNPEIHTVFISRLYY